MAKRKTEIGSEAGVNAIPTELAEALVSLSKIEYVFLSTDAKNPGWFFQENRAKKNFATYSKIPNPNFKPEK
jgi:hypothetical protein